MSAEGWRNGQVRGWPSENDWESPVQVTYWSFPEQTTWGYWHHQEVQNVIVPADKTRNFYAVTADQYEKLMTNNITKNYRQHRQEHTCCINQPRSQENSERVESRRESEMYGEERSLSHIKGPQAEFSNSSTVPTWKPSKKRCWNNL